METSNTRRQTPNNTLSRTFSSRPNSFSTRSTTSILPTQTSTITSSYPDSSYHRPLSSSLMNNSNGYINSSFLHQKPEQNRFNSTSIKPFESMREPFLSTRLNALRTSKYVPPSFNRYYLP
jgi:hypothetical protein